MGTASAADQPDLRVVDVKVQPEDPKAGENVEFCIVVENVGTAAADTIEVRGYVDGELAAVPPTTTLGPGERKELPCTGNNEFSGGSYTVRGVIDPNDHIRESDELNNDHTTSFGVETSYGSITGRVVDDTGAPVAGAKVYRGTSDDTRTDSEGYFRYEQVPTGDYSLDVAVSGYVADGPKPVTVHEGRTAQVDFELTPETHAVHLDSEPISAYTTGSGEYDFGEDVRIEAPATVDGYEFKAWTSDDGTVVSQDPSFTIDYVNRDYDITAQYTEPGKPDLTVNDVAVDPSSPEAGDSVTFEVELANQGDARASNFDVKLVAGSTIYRSENLDLGASNSGSIELGEWTAEQGVEDARVIVDSGDDVDEEDESNNHHTESLDVINRQSNLRVVDVATSPKTPKAGDEISFEVTVENTGPVKAEDFGVLVDVAGDQYSKTQLDLDPRSRRTVTIGAWESTAAVEDGEVIVDFRDHVDESDETDNTDQFRVSVDESVPDLTVEDVSWEPTEPTVGETVTVTVDVANSGTQPVSGFDVMAQTTGERVTRSAVTIPADTTRSLEIGPLRIGNDSDVIVGAVDPSGEVQERNENNNEKTESVTVQHKQPDLSVGTLRTTPDTPESGDEVTQYVRVVNTGGRPVEDVAVALFVDGNQHDVEWISLQPDSATLVEFDSTWKATADSHDILVKADANDQIRESRETNNRNESTVDIAPSPGTLAITVQNDDDDPVTGATVETVGPVEETSVTDSAGTTTFQEMPQGTYLLQVSGDEIVGGSHTVTTTVTPDGSNDVQVTVDTTDEKATLGGTVEWEDGTAVDEGTAILKVDDEDGTRTAPVYDGSFQFSDPVQPNNYRLIVRGDDEVVAEESVNLDSGSNSVSVTASEAGHNVGRLKAGVTGVVMGDWCWRDDGSPPAYCGDEVKKYPIAFFSGWLASGFAIVGDIRDLPSTALKGKPADFGLTLLGLVPAYGDAVSSVSKVGKFISKFPSKGEDLAEIIARSRFFDGQRLTALDELYDGSGTYLVRNSDMSEDEVIKLADEGNDLRDVRRLTEMGFSADAIRGLERTTWADPQRTRMWLDDVEEINAGNGGVKDMPQKINDELVEGQAPGTLYNAKIASYSKREADVVGRTIGDGRNVKRVEHDISTPSGKTDIDVLMSDGTAVEAKRSLPTDEQRASDLLRKFEKFEQWQSREGYEQADRYLVVATEKSELRKRNPELVDQLREQGVKIVTDRDEAVRSLRPASPHPSDGMSSTISTKYSSVASV